MRTRVLILQNHPNEGPCRLPVALTEAAVDYDVVHAYSDGVPDGLTYDALVVLGGPKAASDPSDHPVLQDAIELVRAYAGSGRPVLGVALGAELAAVALGGSVLGGDAFGAGWSPVHLTDAGYDDPVAAPLQAAPAVFHLDGNTIDPPPGAVALASAEMSDGHAFRQGSVIGLPFHVEVDPETARTWLATNRARIEAHGLDIDACARAPPGTATGLDRVLERIALFLDGRL